jgi:hypothetical protein
MEGRTELRALLARSHSFQQVPLYNRQLVNPYLLASHGLVFVEGKAGPVATCSDPLCSLTLEFDDAEEVSKEDLELALCDHDDECSFAKVRGNAVDLALFVQLGS